MNQSSFRMIVVCFGCMGEVTINKNKYKYNVKCSNELREIGNRNDRFRWERFVVNQLIYVLAYMQY